MLPWESLLALLCISFYINGIRIIALPLLQILQNCKNYVNMDKMLRPELSALITLRITITSDVATTILEVPTELISAIILQVGGYYTIYFFNLSCKLSITGMYSFK